MKPDELCGNDEIQNVWERTDEKEKYKSKMNKRGKESRLKGSDTLHIVGCVSMHKEKPGNDRLTQFLDGSEGNFDNEDYDGEDEASDLKAENQRRVEEMLQKAKVELSKKREESTVEEESTAPPNKPGRRANALEMLHKMEWLRNQSDHNELGRTNKLPDEKHAVVSLPNKNKENVEYFCGTKSNKTKNKKKNRPEIVINLEELERPLLEAAAAQQKHSSNHKLPKQKARAVSPPPYTPPAVTCWQQKSGADLFPEVQTRTLTIYGTSNTDEDELLKLAIEESLKTHEAESSRFIDLTEGDRFDRLRSKASNSAGIMQFPVPDPIEDEVWDKDDVARKPVMLENISPTERETHKISAKKDKEFRSHSESTERFQDSVKKGKASRSQSMSVERFQEVSVPAPYDTGDDVWDDNSGRPLQEEKQRQHGDDRSPRAETKFRKPQRQYDNRDHHVETRNRQRHTDTYDNRHHVVERRNPQRQHVDTYNNRNTSSRQSVDVGHQRHVDTYNNRSASSRQSVDVGHHVESRNTQRHADTYDNRSASSRQSMDVGHHVESRNPQRHADTYDNRSASSRQSMDVGHHVESRNPQRRADTYDNRSASSRQSVESRNPQRHADTCDNRSAASRQSVESRNPQRHTDTYDNRSALSRQPMDMGHSQTSRHESSKVPRSRFLECGDDEDWEIDSATTTPRQYDQASTVERQRRHVSPRHVDEVWEFDSDTTTPRQDISEQHRRYVESCVAVPQEYSDAYEKPHKWLAQTEESGAGLRVTSRGSEDSGVCVMHDENDTADVSVEQFFRFEPVSIPHSSEAMSTDQAASHMKFEPMSVPHTSDQTASQMRFEPMPSPHTSDQAASQMRFETHALTSRFRPDCVPNEV